MDFVSAAVSSLLQVLLFAAVPFVVYLATRRRARGFFGYVGLVQPERRSMLWAMVLILATAPLTLVLFFLPGFRAVTLAPGTVGGDFAALDPSAATLTVVVVSAFVKAGLAEELLFRGFVAKRLIGRLGFARGNALQAAVFASPHLLIFAVPGSVPVSASAVAPLFLTTAAVGWAFGFLNERAGNGSIAPSWWAHGLGNDVAYGAAVYP